jgi:small subunit ribosomal protein S15
VARLHSRKKGKSGTRRSRSPTPPEWLDLDENGIKELIVRMGKEGISPSKIALSLRDQHAVPDVRYVLGMSITSFMKKEDVMPQYPEDLMNLIRKAVRMRNHLKGTGKRDLHNKVKLGHVESKINRLVRYYRDSGALPKDWKYNPDTAALLVK